MDQNLALTDSLRAGSRWSADENLSTSTHGIAVSAKSSGEAARRQSEPALISTNMTYVADKEKPSKFV